MVDKHTVLHTGLVREYFRLFQHYPVAQMAWFTCIFSWLVPHDFSLMGPHCILCQLIYKTEHWSTALNNCTGTVALKKGVPSLDCHDCTCLSHQAPNSSMVAVICIYSNMLPCMVVFLTSLCLKLASRPTHSSIMLGK